MPSVHIERELKFYLTRGAFPRLRRLARERRNVESVYYDTPEQHLRHAGFALRLRRDGGRWLQTLKYEPTEHAGVSARAEWETGVRGKALDLGGFAPEEIKAATGFDLVTVELRLRPIFSTRFVRHFGEVKLARGARAELAIDRGAIVAGRRRETIEEVELELKSGSPRELLRFAERLALPLAYESKAQRGYRLASGEARAPRKWRLPALDPSASPGAAFALLFSEALAQAGANTQGVLDSSDPEYLHQVRVGLARLRATLRAFDAMLGKTKALRRRLRRLMKALGPARDWDVLMRSLADAGADRGLMARAARRRDAARLEARAALSSARFQVFLLRALRWIESQPWRASRDSLGGFGAKALKRLRRRLRPPADWASAKRRHALRIRVKRLRYACEFFAPCFPRVAVVPYVKRLHALQDLLGELNDIAVGRKLLAQLDERSRGLYAARERRLIVTLRRAWAAFEKQPPYWRARA